MNYPSIRFLRANDGNLQVVIDVNPIIEVRADSVLLPPLLDFLVVLASMNHIAGGCRRLRLGVPLPNIAGDICITHERLAEGVDAVVGVRCLNESSLESSKILLPVVVGR